jgi:hypothetical protein
MDGENGKTTGRRDEWENGVNEKLDKIIKRLDDAFEPEGFCARARGRLANVTTSLKIQWILLGGINITIIMQALKR